MQRYCSAKRFAFNRLLEGLRIDEIVNLLESKSSLSLNWRYCEHATRDALARIKSRRELLPLYLSEVYDMIEDVTRKLERVRNVVLSFQHNPLKVEKMKKRISSLERRLSYLSRKRDFLKDHIVSGTIPKVVFGTRRMFNQRIKGTIANSVWKGIRDNQVYSIGQASQGGNANIRISEGLIGMNFPEAIEPRRAKGKTCLVRNMRTWFAIEIPQTFQRYLDFLKAGAYSVRVIRKCSRYFAEVSFRIDGVKVRKSHLQTIASVDSNPGGFAVTIVRKDGNLLAHRFFRDDRLTYALRGKRKSILGETVGRIIDYVKANNAEALVIEDLEMRKHSDFGAKTNRIIYAFARKKFCDNITTRCWKESFPIFTVNPAHTSLIAEVKFKERYGLSIHEAAGLCIGRRFFGFGEALEKPIAVRIGKDRMNVMYVWASIYGYQCYTDPFIEPPRRKGSRGERRSNGNEAVFTGQPASVRTPRIREEVRKGGNSGENPEATGNGGKPALKRLGGKATASSLDIVMSKDMLKTNL